MDAYIATFAAGRDENGRRLVVRNGYHQSREVLTSAGAVEVTAPRVNAPHLVALVRARTHFERGVWSSAPRRPRHD
jgi:hypothetical protein